MKKKLFVSLALLASISSLSGCNLPDHEHHCHGNDCLPPYQEATLRQDELLRQGPTLGAASGFIVQNHQTEYAIVIPEISDANLNYCASFLQSNIQLVTKATMPIKSDNEVGLDLNGKYISVGNTKIKQLADLSSVDYTKLNTGGYFLKKFGNTYILDSNCKEGKVYAVNEFLSNFFHLEFLTPDDTFIPKLTDVPAYDIDYLTIPAFDIRDYYYYPVWYQGIEWGSKLRSNSSSYKAVDKINGAENYTYYGHYYTKDGVTNFLAREGHTIQTLLCTDAYNKGFIPDPWLKEENYQGSGSSKWYPVGYFVEHPDWYAYDPSYDRINSQGYSQEEVCYTNGLDDNGDYIPQDHETTPEKDKSLVTKMAEIVAEMVISEPSPNAYFLMLGHADWYAKCKCEKCLAAYEKYRTYGGTTIVWGNAVVKEAKRILASKNCTRPFKVVMFAYSKSIDSPTIKGSNGVFTPVSSKVIAHDDIVIKMAYRNCVYHSLWDENCVQNEVLRDRFNGWSKIAKSFVIWDYTACFTDLLFYMPNFGTIQDNYKYYQSIGVKHLLSQGSPNEYRYYESNVHAYALSQMMWDPAQNINQIIKRFNNLMFTEKYARYVNEYRALMDNYYAMQDATLEGGYHASTTYELDFTNANSYSLPVLLKACDVIETALEGVRNDPLLSQEDKDQLELRLRSVKITPQYMILSMKMLVNADEIKVLATDFFKSIEMLKLTYMREGNLNANSFEEMKKGYDLD